MFITLRPIKEIENILGPSKRENFIQEWVIKVSAGLEKQKENPAEAR